MFGLFKDEKFRTYLIQTSLAFCIVMTLGILCGYLMPHGFTVPAVKYVIMDSASAKIMDISNNDIFKVVAYLVNNSVVSLMLVVIPLIYYMLIGDNVNNKRRIEPYWISILMLSLQAMLIGLVIGFSIPIVNNNLLIITALLPHGIVEIPAFLVACAMGIWFIKESRPKIEVGYKGLAVLFLNEVVFLLFIAAVLETYVTPWLITFVK